MAGSSPELYYSFIVVGMRKRSGALHSDSSEQFMLLAEYAHQKNGYFYDESLHREVKQKLKSKIRREPSRESEHIHPHFLGFDYAAHDQLQAEENEELWAESHSTEINFVLICSHPCLIRAKLQQLWPSDHSSSLSEHPKRELDLFLVNQSCGNHHNHCYKFWLISQEHSESVLYSSYLKRAKRIVRFGESQGGPGESWSESEAKGVLFSMVASETD